MIKEYRGVGPYYDVTVSSQMLTIDGADYNLDELQNESQRIIDIVDNDMFVANIIIPPAIYETVVVDDEEGVERRPVEMDRVAVILWTKEEETIDDDDHN